MSSPPEKHYKYREVNIFVQISIVFYFCLKANTLTYKIFPPQLFHLSTLFTLPSLST